MTPLPLSPPRVSRFRVALPRALRADPTDSDLPQSLPCLSLSLSTDNTPEPTHHRLTLLEAQTLAQALTEAAGYTASANETTKPAEIVFRLNEDDAYRLSTSDARLLAQTLGEAQTRLVDEPPILLCPIPIGVVLTFTASAEAVVITVNIDGEVDTPGAPRRIQIDIRHAPDRTTTLWLDDAEVETLDHALEYALNRSLNEARDATALSSTGPVGQLFEGDPAQGAAAFCTIHARERGAVELRVEEDTEGDDAFSKSSVLLAGKSAKELRRLLREASLVKRALPDAPAAREDDEILISAS